MAPITQLPSEIVSLLVEYVAECDLFACTLLNKQFYMVTNPLLWRLPRTGTYKTTRKFLNSLYRAQNPVGHYIRTVNLEGYAWTDSEFLLLIYQASLLEELVLSFTTFMTNDTIQLLPRLCPNLKALHFGDPVLRKPQCDNYYTWDEDNHHHNVFRYLNREKINAATLSALVNCPLERLSIVNPPLAMLDEHPEKSVADLARFHRLTNLTLFMVPMDFFKRVFSSNVSWPCLVKLSIAGYHCNMRVGMDRVGGDDALIPFLQSHPGLKALHLMHSLLSNTLLNGISDIHHPGITDITLKLNNAVSLCAVRRLVWYSPVLKYVTFDGREIGIDTLSESAKKCMSTNGCQHGRHESGSIPPLANHDGRYLFFGGGIEIDIGIEIARGFSEVSRRF